ncbi:sulfite exporter TauE/SafE family protein [Brevundimonas sp. R86498]|uniref:sulfite exporter TauE/SafE family protein n=1 Tax=Brevundimonas sp. R86498 TaxID=3093845 RepID=UPI0037C84A8D
MDPDFWLFLAVGFGAQLVDGCLGMAYGVVSTSALLSMGVTPAAASASVHAAKVFTGAASAASHVAHRNVDWRMLVPLSIGGVVGGCLGTYLLTSVNGELIRPFVVGWLFIMGVVILYRAWRNARPKGLSIHAPGPLGLIGGFFDAVGGGGWGPVVTSTLLSSGENPRKAIGTTNSAELFVAIAISASFITAVLTGHWRSTEMADHLWSVLGLIAGGVIAAPIAGWVTKVLPIRVLTWMVGILIVALAIWQGVQIILS